MTQVPEDWEIATDELWEAVERGDDLAVDAAIAAGADVRSTNELASTPLHVAAERGREAAVLSLLARGAELDVKSRYDGWTPLHCAAVSGNVACVSALLDAGADANERDGISWTPLHVAARYGHLPCTKLLVERGEADLNVRGSDGRTPLTIAVLNNQPTVQQYLESVGGTI